MSDKKAPPSGGFKRKLLNEILGAAVRGEERLSPEAEIAERFGVSRQLVRDTLSSFEQEGFVSRVHGVGTIINRHVVSVSHRVDIEKEFLPTLRDAGYDAKVSELSAAVIPADRAVAERLRVPEGSEIIEAKRVVTADGRPAIYCVDYFPASEGKTAGHIKAKLRESVFAYLEKEEEIEIQMAVAELEAVRCDKTLAEIFGLTEKNVVLAAHEVGYDFFGEPRFYSRVYYRPGVLKHTVVRKKIG